MGIFDHVTDKNILSVGDIFDFSVWGFFGPKFREQQKIGTRSPKFRRKYQNLFTSVLFFLVTWLKIAKPFRFTENRVKTVIKFCASRKNGNFLSERGEGHHQF